MDLKMLRVTPPWEWPRGTDKMLLEILSDDRVDESDCLLAAELAGDSTVINNELADALLSILRSDDAPAKLCAKAAIALGPVLEQADLDGFEFPEDVPITEQTFQRIQESFHDLYLDADVPKEVRRRILEASIRSPQHWHQDAIRTAYSCDDEEWKLTAVFAMRWVRGFDDQILEALENENEDIHCEAVCAAGNWGLAAAWSHVRELVTSMDTDKFVLLAAIDAVASIRPREAGGLLVDLTNSHDEDIVEAAFEAMAMAEGPRYDVYGDDVYDDEGEDYEYLH